MLLGIARSSQEESRCRQGNAAKSDHATHLLGRQW
jgi:hypothetical protein